MTDNQYNQLFDLVTKCVNGIQELRTGQEELKTDVAVLKTDVAELKVDVAELKDGQNRIEKQIRLNNSVVNERAGEQLRINTRVTELEKATV